MAKKKDDGTKIIADNRKARFAYAIEGEERPPKVDEMVQWTISSDERRELGRAGGRQLGL
jgi:hypothetical protein